MALGETPTLPGRLPESDCEEYLALMMCDVMNGCVEARILGRPASHRRGRAENLIGTRVIYCRPFGPRAALAGSCFTFRGCSNQGRNRQKKSRYRFRPRRRCNNRNKSMKIRDIPSVSRHINQSQMKSTSLPNRVRVGRPGFHGYSYLSRVTPLPH